MKGPCPVCSNPKAALALITITYGATGPGMGRVTVSHGCGKAKRGEYRKRLKTLEVH